MTCPDLGHWRAWLDRELTADADGLDEHLTGCADCAALVSELRCGATVTADALAMLAAEEAWPAAPSVEQALALVRAQRRIAQVPARNGRAAAAGVGRGFPRPEAGAKPASAGPRLAASTTAITIGADPAPASSAPVRRGAAWQSPPGDRDAVPSRSEEGGNLAQRIPSGEQLRMTMLESLRRWRIAAAGLAAALALVLLVGTPEGRTAFAQFLAQFRSQRFAVVTIDPASGVQPFTFLENVGRLEGRPNGRAAEEVATIAEASERVGFPVKEPDPAALPAGTAQRPDIAVLPSSTLRFTFDKAEAQAYFERTGHPDVDLPDKFDGASLVVEVSASAILSYDAADGAPRIGVHQAREVTAGAEGGVSLDELRTFLLGLPGLPEDTVRQLRDMQDWRNTLPIPVPVDRVAWQQTTVAGNPGLLLSETGGIGSAVIWGSDGRVYGVAGAVGVDEIRRVAESLR